PGHDGDAGRLGTCTPAGDRALTMGKGRQGGDFDNGLYGFYEITIGANLVGVKFQEE
ncbi:MAG: hypothetical protein Q9180_003864, partial [Flavoplaca navasiana]